MKHISLFILFNLFVNIGLAQENTVNPTPQHFNFYGSIEVPSHFTIQKRPADKAILHLLSQYFTDKNTGKDGIVLRVGNITDKFPKKLLKKVPSKPESYYLKIDEKRINVIGRDARGTFYGLQTLIALLKSSKLPLGEIMDYPDVAARGVVEGFYGNPWSFEHRMRQIKFYGSNKLNTYIYGPKDDPYHSSPHWRKPYPKEEAVKLQKLIKQASLNKVDFVWAIHPGQDIKWNIKDRNALVHKFELMYDLGVRAFAVFFDDISGEGTDPTQQAELLNYLNKHFVQAKSDVNPLIMCPTEYNKSWSNPEGGYLETLGEKLDPSIRIMWTGNSVVSDIDKETMNWINDKINRKAFIWWNYPVSDYVRDHLLLGPTYGNGKDIANDVSGFVSNPMEHAEASKIAIYGVADYTWNMTDYNPNENWHKALKTLMPKSYKALAVFARHNSDLGPNGHRYRRKESVAFAPQAEHFLKQLKADKAIDNIDKIRDEFSSIVEASYVLLNSKENPVLIDEIRPWVKQFRLTGQAGLSMINMYEALVAKKIEEFEQSYKAIKAIKSEMYRLDSEKNQNPYQPGIETASLVITPMINKSFSYLTEKYNREFDKNLVTQAAYNPHKLFTNIARLKHQQLSLNGKTLSLNPPLEVIRVEPKGYFGFQLFEDAELKEFSFKLIPASNYSNLEVEVSNNGSEWEKLPVKNKGEVIKISPEQDLKYIRVINSSNSVVEVKIEQVTAKLK